MFARSNRTYVLLAGIAFFVPLLLHAQAVDMSALNSTTGTPFTLSVSSQNPTPYTSVTITPISSSVNVSNATITMSIGKNQIYKGSARPVSIPVGAGGVPIPIIITATDSTGSYPQMVTIVPQDVALVAEPVSTAPVFYLGKPLVPLNGATRVVAVANLRTPTGQALNPSSLSYTWTLDDQLMSDYSGIGRSSFLVASPLQYRESTVQVTVQNSDGSIIGSDSLTLDPQEPTVRIYEDDPLLGIRTDSALSNNYSISGSEDTFYAAPFSFPTVNGNPTLTWYLNGAQAQTGSLLTLRPTGSGGGNANLSVVASGGPLISAAEKLFLSFGQSSGSNFFGL